MPKEPVLYEAMYIFDVELSEEKIAELEDTLKTSLETNGAEFIDVQPFGRRRFTFEILGRREGVYRIMYFKGDGKAVEEIRHEFILSEDILRGMVTVANPRMIVGAKPPEKPAAVVAEPVVEEEAAEEVTEEAPVEEAAAEEVVAEEVVEEAVAEEVVAEAPVEEAVAEEVVAEAPVEEAVAEEVVAEAPVEEAVAEEVVAEAPVEEAAAEEVVAEAPVEEVEVAAEEVVEEAAAEETTEEAPATENK